jgi:hypothetical protein
MGREEVSLHVIVIVHVTNFRPRAGERFLDLTAQERARRRERGWGNDAVSQ